MEAKGLVYNPHTESFERPNSKPELSPAQSASPKTAPSAQEFIGDFAARHSITNLAQATAPMILREWQQQFLERWFTCNDSCALQAGTGQGKTLASLLAAAAVLQRGGRVIYVVHTDEQATQVRKTAATLFGDEFAQAKTSILSGKGGPGRREQEYQDADKQLLIVLAPSLARDIVSPRASISQPRFLLSTSQLVIMDEADLMRGSEPLAIIHRKWKMLPAHEQPRALLQSASFTLRHNLVDDSPVVFDLKHRLAVGMFYHVKGPQELSFSFSRPEVVRLPQDVCIASAQLRAQYWQAIDRVEELYGGTDELRRAGRRNKEPDYTDSDQWYRSSHSHTLPSIKLLNKLINRVKVASAPDALRECYLALTIFHLNELLVNQPRVEFLEYAGRILHSVQTNSNKLSQYKKLFPKGTPPPWWRTLARGTPYEQLPHEKDSRDFFCSETSLGLAARELLKLHLTGRFKDHPLVEQVTKFLNSQYRKSRPHQALIYCASAIGAIYFSEYAKARVSDSSLTLLGHSHLEGKHRQANFSRAASGEAQNIVATSVVDRGIDISKLGYLIMLGVPYNLTQLLQLCGRVGRDRALVEKGLACFYLTEGSSAQAKFWALRSSVGIELDQGSPFHEEIRSNLDTRAKRKREELSRTPSLFDGLE